MECSFANCGEKAQIGVCATFLIGKKKENILLSVCKKHYTLMKAGEND
jgi:hypothetical protein